MTQNHLIGIGGTGARALEAVTHLCACGLGPDTLTMSFVDADKGNGNLARATQLLELYQQLRERLRNEGGADQGQSDIGEDCALFGTKIATLPQGSHWSPVPAGNDNMRELFSSQTMSEDARDLFDGLYNKHEQTLDLTEGFRARPAIGAAVSLAGAQPEEPFWDSLLQALKEPQQGEESRIFLVASIFGGTGAAGFPAIAKLLRETLRDAGVRQGVHISGALVLPYFRFDAKSGQNTQSAPGSDIFLAQTRASLKHYYHQMTGDPTLFDNIYFIGWPELIPVGDSHPGGMQQNNPPLIPELSAALASLTFFRSSEVPDKKLYRFGKRADRNGQPVPFGWEDLPDVTADRNWECRDRLGQALRFAIALDLVYGEYLTVGNGEVGIGIVENQAWYRKLIEDAGVDISMDRHQDLLKKTRQYCQNLMRWSMTLCARSQTSDLKIALFETRYLAGNKLLADGLLALNDKAEEHHMDGFSDLVHGKPADTLAELFDALTYSKPPKNTMRMGVFLRSLYEHCSLPE
ncbi:tubulin-like doman-containing protein [Magnetospira sp. QH-2]|uniref:tubulin-like doman-containing protein n=1 Tax=Magnetospira sp. (strain QH-2) TaxID=1288970 RepID=UPI0003E8107B|nr:tubulin-like doman-containing protein [Magnetospira sp. QH-2]CCQ73200.1 Conserved protein of unknown function [Magnetospira sp. QH-2]